MKTEYLIGLDLGGSSIKWVEILKRPEGLSLIRVDLREISASGDSAQETNEKITALTELSKGKVLKNYKVIVSLNCPNTGVKLLELPAMPGRELKEVVQLEAKQKFHLSQEDYSLDFEQVGEADERGTKKIRVEVAYSPRKTTDEAFNLLKKVGIKPQSIIPATRALEQIIRERTLNPNGVLGVMDIGAKQSEFLIFKGKRLVFSRKIQLGGHNFTQSMMGVFASERGKVELHWTEAEALKRSSGLPATEKVEMIDEKISNIHLHSMLRTPLEQLTNEIERGLQYYQQESKGEKIERFLLYGRGACLKGLTSFLSESLDLEVSVGNPLDGMRIEAQTFIPEEGFGPYAVALGAALTLGRGANLLPPEIKEESKRTLQRASLQSLVIGTFLVLVFIYTGLRIQLANLDKRISTAQLEFSSLQLSIGEMEKQQSVIAVASQEPPWEEIFKELSNVVPEGIVLTELQVDPANKKIHIQGLIKAKAREEILSGFIREMETGIFRNVKLIKVRVQSDQDESRFELECWVDTE